MTQTFVPVATNPKLAPAVFSIGGRHPRHAFRPIASSLLKDVDKRVHVVLRHQTVQHVAGPPIHRVSSWHEPLVVLHELTVPDDQLAVVPYLLHLLTQGRIGAGLVHTKETTVLQHHPRPFSFVTGGDGAGFTGALDFHLRPDRDEIVQRQHGGGVGGRSGQTGGSGTAVPETKTARLERSTEDGAACNDVLHELGNRLNLLGFKPVFSWHLVLFTACGKLSDEVPPRNAQSLGVLLNLRRFQAHALPDDEEDTTSNACFVDVADVAVPCALDAFGGLAVDHHRTGTNDFVDFLRRWAILQVATVESEFFLHSLHFRVGRLVVADVQLASNHVGDENGEGLGRTARRTNWAGEVHRHELRAVDVVE